MLSTMRRIHKHRARSFIVDALEASPVVASVPDEWEEMVYVEMVSGQRAAIYLVDRFLDIDEVMFTFTDNSQRGIHTFYLLAAAMFLPDVGTPYLADDWMLALMRLYGGKIYGFRVMRELVDISPVYFTDEGGGYYSVYYGDKINLDELVCYTVDLDEPDGTWLIAEVEAAARRNAPPPQDGTSGYAHAYAPDGKPIFENDPVAPTPDFRADDPYRVLGLATTADRETIKATFRALARQYHPDVDASAGAKARMQALNNAYRQLMANRE